MTMGGRRIAILLSASVMLAACGKKDDFLYFNPQKNTRVSIKSNIKEIFGASGVDILWVIDNSGSMSSHQANVIANTKVFMDEFVKYKLAWKMGLISTDQWEVPYLGFAKGDEFDSMSPQPVTRFQSAVSKLGTSGSGTEKTFTPILQQLAAYPNFHNPASAVAVILITDAEEQSGLIFDDFLAEFKKQIGPNTRFFVHAVLSADELGCLGEDGHWNYKGSPYEQFVDAASSGKTYPICAPDFGKTLSQISFDITQQVTRSTVYLKKRPKAKTLSVLYHGQALKGGSLEDGAVWYYDYDVNAVVFYTLDFATDPTDSVEVVYDEDDGL